MKEEGTIEKEERAKPNLIVASASLQVNMSILQLKNMHLIIVYARAQKQDAPSLRSV